MPEYPQTLARGQKLRKQYKLLQQWHIFQAMTKLHSSICLLLVLIIETKVKPLRYVTGEYSAKISIANNNKNNKL